VKAHRLDQILMFRFIQHPVVQALIRKIDANRARRITRRAIQTQSSRIEAKIVIEV